MRPKLGTYNWVIMTGGKLAFRDRIGLVYQGVCAKLAARSQRKMGEKIRFLEVDEILPPDSPICLEAIAIAEAASPPYLFNHCLRAYFWARLMNGAVPFDDEATFTALMLHDLGLTESYRLNGDGEQCFTLPGARAGVSLALKQGWSDKRAALIADAITLHLNVIVDDKHGREAQLVRLGSGADVAGLGMSRVGNDQIGQVLERYPRLDLKRKIAADLEMEVSERPCCRISFLYHQFDFGRYIIKSSFIE